jgi:hypothetical protein
MDTWVPQFKKQNFLVFWLFFKKNTVFVFLKNKKNISFVVVHVKGGVVPLTLPVTRPMTPPPVTLPRNLDMKGSARGGEIDIRNFPQFSAISQFSAIFRNFPQFSAIFRNFPQFSAIFRNFFRRFFGFQLRIFSHGKDGKNVQFGQTKCQNAENMT